MTTHSRWARRAALASGWILMALASAAQEAPGDPGGEPAAELPVELTAEQLDALVAPVALFPDPVLALMLTAATEPEQVASAAKFARVTSKLVTGIGWEPSVNALTSFPGVLVWMDDQKAWTQQVGAAMAGQEDDVLASVQHYRTRAMAAGKLASGPGRTVTVSGGIISILPTEPTVVQIPDYDPQATLAGSGDVTYAEVAVDTAEQPYDLYSLDWADGGVYVGGSVTTIQNPVLVGAATRTRWHPRAFLLPGSESGVPAGGQRLDVRRAGVTPVSAASLPQPWTRSRMQEDNMRRIAVRQEAAALSGYQRGQDAQAASRRGQRARSSFASADVPRSQRGLAPGTSSFQGRRTGSNTAATAGGAVPRYQMGLVPGTRSASGTGTQRARDRGRRSRSSER